MTYHELNAQDAVAQTLEKKFGKANGTATVTVVAEVGIFMLLKHKRATREVKDLPKPISEYVIYDLERILEASNHVR